MDRLTLCSRVFRHPVVGILPLIGSVSLATACPSDRSPKKRGSASERNEDEDAGRPAPKDEKADEKPKEAAAEAQPAPEPAPEAKANPFRKGQVAPTGLNEENLKLYAEAQGDPLKGEFTLEQAFEGDETLANPEAGKLMATFKTSMGSFDCTLFEDKTPKTVANFVGLARGVRPTYDPKKDEWTKIPYFNGILFHRVVEGFMVQTGDPTGSGNGHPGYVIPDEIDPSLKHNKAGILSMANRGPNTGGSQYFVTVRDTPHLDGKHTVFGQCEPKVAIAISKVEVNPRFNNRPVEPVTIESVEIKRSKKK